MWVPLLRAIREIGATGIYYNLYTDKKRGARMDEAMRKVGAINNTLYVTIPKDMAQALAISKGDTLSMQRDGDGIRVVKHEPDESADKMLAEIEAVMQDHAFALDYLRDK